MKGVVAQLRDPLASSMSTAKNEPLQLLAVACQERPIDPYLARAALSLFRGSRVMDPEGFESRDSEDYELAMPEPTNLRIEYAESLTTAGFMAYIRAMQYCEKDSERYWDR